MVKYICPYCGKEFEHEEHDDPYAIVCYEPNEEDGYHECECLICNEIIHKGGVK